MENMNPVIKAQLKEFIKSNPEELKLDSAYFEVMSIFSIEKGLLGQNINPFRAHLKGEEFGIDGIAIMVQGSLCIDADEVEEVISVGRNHTSEFHFFQSKTSEKMEYGEVSKFLDGIYDFFSDVNLLNGKQIDELVAAKDLVYSSVAKINPILSCYYCTTGSGEVSSAIQKLIESGKNRLEALNIFSEVKFDCVGAKRLQDGYRSATNSTSAVINFSKSITLPIHDKVEEAHIGYISADQLLEIALGEPDGDGVRHINRAVFYDNVRDFNPLSDINNSIISELNSGDLRSFVFKNNGVTVVAKNITRKGDNFNLEDYQIVNGCQTTNILALAQGNSKKIYVPFRLIGCQDPDFVATIIVGTNKQNEVREDQFWALLPLMKDLEEYCAAQDDDAKILIERRDNQYRGVAVERTRIIRPSDLMKAAAATFFYQPHRAARDHRGIRREFSSKIFRQNHSVELYHAAALALYKFDYMVRTGKVDRAWSIYKFYCLYSLFKKQWEMPNILDAPPKSQQKVLNGVRSILSSNENYISHIEAVARKLESITVKSSPKNREQIRDYIRSETVVDTFSQEFFKK